MTLRTHFHFNGGRQLGGLPPARARRVIHSEQEWAEALRSQTGVGQVAGDQAIDNWARDSKHRPRNRALGIPLSGRQLRTTRSLVTFPAFADNLEGREWTFSGKASFFWAKRARPGAQLGIAFQVLMGDQVVVQVETTFNVPAQHLEAIPHGGWLSWRSFGATFDEDARSTVNPDRRHNLFDMTAKVQMPETGEYRIRVVLTRGAQTPMMGGILLIDNVKVQEEDGIGPPPDRPLTPGPEEDEEHPERPRPGEREAPEEPEDPDIPEDDYEEPPPPERPRTGVKTVVVPSGLLFDLESRRFLLGPKALKFAREQLAQIAAKAESVRGGARRAQKKR